ncbi:hypothetical protein B0J14DRAFT_656671 [Halenospora varia]|nr:hypothetical protein B0J14DRAFT_656671 [Halenospora varia]
MSFNHYQVLGVRLAAGRSEIRAAYQRLAREYHPDRNPGDNSVVAVMQHVNEAYEVLSDEKKRHEYDFERGWRQTPPPIPTQTPSPTPARSSTPPPPPQPQPRRRSAAGPSAAPRGGPANFFGPQGQQKQQQQAPRPSIPELDGRIKRMRAEAWKAATAAQFLFRRVAWEESRNALLIRYLEIEPLLDSQSLTERRQLRNQLVRDKQAYENGEAGARDEKTAEAMEMLGSPTRQNLAIDEYFGERVKKWSRLGEIPAAGMVLAPYKGQVSIETPW